MTREEFRDDIQDWDDLITFCRDNDLEDCIDGIVRSDEIDDIVRNLLDRSGWDSVANFLADIHNTCRDYYHIDGYENLEELSYSDFDSYKDEAEEEYENTVGFDDDDDADGCPLEI